MHPASSDLTGNCKDAAVLLADAHVHASAGTCCCKRMPAASRTKNRAGQVAGFELLAGIFSSPDIHPFLRRPQEQSKIIAELGHRMSVPQLHVRRPSYRLQPWMTCRCGQRFGRKNESDEDPSTMLLQKKHAEPILISGSKDLAETHLRLNLKPCRSLSPKPTALCVCLPARLASPGYTDNRRLMGKSRGTFSLIPASAQNC